MAGYSLAMSALPPSDPSLAKQDLRVKMRAVVNNLSAGHRAAASARARGQLEQKAVWQNAHSVLLFAPMHDEPDIWLLLSSALKSGKVVALPRFDAATDAYSAAQIKNPARDTREGRFGVREPAGSCPPVPLNRLDFVLVPGVAFDLRGRRLGRGKGYFDRLLAAVRGTKCGVAFDEQIVTEIPFEPHDVLVNCILTPMRWFDI